MTRWIEALLLPPGGPILLAAAGIGISRRRPGLGRFLVAAGLLLLYASSTPLVAAALLAPLQEEARERAARGVGADVVVVLGADLRTRPPFAPDDGGATLGPLTLERLRAGARIARERGLPLWLSGGPVARGAPPVARAMAAAARRDFSIEPAVVEEASRTTRDNAARTAAFLAERGAARILLVTHAWHVPRAAACFERRGVVCAVAPVGFERPPDLRPAALLPSARALRFSRLALHEWLGRAYYVLVDRPEGRTKKR